jgi:hypothetical protein
MLKVGKKARAHSPSEITLYIDDGPDDSGRQDNACAPAHADPSSDQRTQAGRYYFASVRGAERLEYSPCGAWLQGSERLFLLGFDKKIPVSERATNSPQRTSPAMSIPIEVEKTGINITQAIQSIPTI